MFSQLPTDNRELNWFTLTEAIAKRFDAEYQNQKPDLPDEVQALPIFLDWQSGKLQNRVTSKFWELAQPKKNQACLDLGCGISFLIYPWRDWNAYFYGQDISKVATEILQSRAPQLNSKLFKGISNKPAHHLESYQDSFFDLAIATGFSCYYPLEYWETVLEQVRRVLKPGGFFVFDVIDPSQDMAEDWSILETYLGAEVFLEDLSDWQALIKKSGAKIVKEQSGELFHLYKIRW
ncbi:class I SAM-dependent methyltransferase [Synechococcus sp. BDU 130192]|uniref:class I SAM-dependent methyltransferase n=1 Tax=Synechococcus sp. BDU 130192 TaxID=2042059 RepID=UPI000C0800E0|nr:class I SAM-dependent methyltransferase [Synechococcus sp. BDU 130192]